MDRMLKDEAYRSELDALRRRGDGAPEAGGGPRGGGGDPADGDEEDGPVSTSEALNMLRQARPPSPESLSLQFERRVQGERPMSTSEALNMLRQARTSALNPGRTFLVKRHQR